jgi:3-hydroxybutyrate dehydrogenase
MEAGMTAARKRTAIVTGATSGIGLGIAHRLAADGCKIVMNSRTASVENAALAESIANEYRVETIHIAADMSKPDECRNLVGQTAERFGSVDILVNNAGIQHVAPVEDFPVEKWNLILATNLSSAFHTSAAAVPFMKKAGWGRIVNIASAHALSASPYKSAYVSAKHGLLGLTKTIALEMAEARVAVTVNAVCPGYVKTPLVDNQIEDQMKAHKMGRAEVIEQIILNRQPTKQFATVEQIGGIVAFLCSPDADQITGTSISVDGGWTAL